MNSYFFSETHGPRHSKAQPGGWTYTVHIETLGPRHSKAHSEGWAYNIVSTVIECIRYYVIILGSSRTIAFPELVISPDSKNIPICTYGGMIALVTLMPNPEPFTIQSLPV